MSPRKRQASKLGFVDVLKECWTSNTCSDIRGELANTYLEH